MLKIEKAMDNGVLNTALEGRLDTTTAPQLEGELREALAGADRLELDLEKLEYISSAGLRVLLSAQKLMAKKGGMTLRHVSEAIMEIFEVTGFVDILNIVND